MPLSLRARIVYPVDRPPIDGGLVTIDGERIIAIESPTRPNHSCHDLGDVALLPGFVNSHTHLEFSHLRAPLGRPGLPLVEWLPLAISERQSRHDQVTESIAVGIGESIAAGTCAIGEIATAEDAAYPDETQLSLEVFLEVIGFSRARADSALVAVNERLALSSGKGSLGLSPHAPYTVSPALLRNLVALARGRDLPVAMHLAESRQELEFLASGTGAFQELLEWRSMWDAEAIPRGTTPTDYLEMLAEAPRALIVHGNYLESGALEYLAEHRERMSVIYCPRTHAYFEHPPYPLAEMLALGVHVAIGTDSRASNPDLSVWREMQQVARTHSLISPATILELGTLSGAKAIGQADHCGSITPGKYANLTAFVLPAGGSRAGDEALAELLHTADEADQVWLRGHAVARPAQKTR
jgi:aminodeoxyfutalosine deaminase